MLMDLPMSPVLSDNYPPNRLPEYRAQLAQLALKWESLLFRRLLFRRFMMRTGEQSHLNRTGALKLTRFLATQIQDKFKPLLGLVPLRPAQMPNVGPQESFDAGNGAGQTDAGMTTP